MPLTGYDAAYPPANPPVTDVVGFYCGGDTIHVWTLQEIEAQTARYRLPIFVRSNPGQANPQIDANQFALRLLAIGCPKGVATVLDLETAVDPAYVVTFGSAMRVEGYKVLPYGSSSTLFKNPVLDGYFVAQPGATAIPSNCVGVQYGQGGNGAWDLDWFLPSIPLWDTKQPQEEEMPYAVTNSAGTGYIVATDLSHKTGIPDPADWTTLIATGNYQSEKFTDALINNVPGS